MLAKDLLNEEKTSEKTILQKMLKAKVCLGHRVSFTHPKMKPYLAGIKNNQTIINLEKTLESLEKAKKFFEEALRSGKTILFLDTNPATSDITKEFAQKTKSFFLVNRWLPGFLTNFPTIAKRLAYFRELKEKEEKGELLKYPKKEQLKFKKELEKLKEFFYGVEECQKMPEVLVVVGVSRHEIAIKEAQKKNLPIIAIVDSDANPEGIDYPIFGNDHLPSSVSYLLSQLIPQEESLVQERPLVQENSVGELIKNEEKI